MKKKIKVATIIGALLLGHAGYVYYHNFSEDRHYRNNGVNNEYMKEIFNESTSVDVRDANGKYITEPFLEYTYQYYENNDTKGFFEYVHQNNIEITINGESINH